MLNFAEPEAAGLGAGVDGEAVGSTRHMRPGGCDEFQPLRPKGPEIAAAGCAATGWLKAPPDPTFLMPLARTMANSGSQAETSYATPGGAAR